MKKIKKIITIISLIILINFNISNSYSYFGTKNTTIDNNINTQIDKADMFIYFSHFYDAKIPESYKYIKLNFKNINKSSELEDSLKKLVYLNLIKNYNIEIKDDEKIKAWGFYRLSEKIFGIKIKDLETKDELLNRNTTIKDLLIVKNFLNNIDLKIEIQESTNKQILKKEAILKDVYNTLINQYYGKDELSKIDLLNGAIEGLTKGTHDKHTVYFPPVKSESFQDSLSGEYEGIGSYVDMIQPGVLKITSPIPGSPSEKAGLKGGDIVIKVDGKEIKKDNSLLEVIRWIKGPAGTNVVLTIQRNGEIKDITITREKIILTNIETKKINSRTYYIHIKSFGENVSNEFKEALKDLKNDRNTKKIILDLRNNGGGYLNEVTEILSYFVAKGEKTATVKYYNSNKNYISKGYDDIDFKKYKIIILQNSGTASASEILIGTLKDYYKDIEIIGEQSYGKGSVQVMKGYSDGSMLKYTIAKWFTGGTQTGIDGIGITPTIELEFDYEKFKKYGRDNQLEKAKYIR